MSYETEPDIVRRAEWLAQEAQRYIEDREACEAGHIMGGCSLLLGAYFSIVGHSSPQEFEMALFSELSLIFGAFSIVLSGAQRVHNYLHHSRQVDSID